MAFCKNCGKPIDDGVAFCPSCGTSQNAQNATPVAAAAPAAATAQATPIAIPPYSQTAAMIICFFLGGLGIHDFYCGRTLYGVIKLILCLTGILSIVSVVWEIVDLIRIIRGTYLDGFGRKLDLNATKSTKIIIIVLLVFPVIVIPAALIAAVIVPLLASDSIAKSKASEVGPAIGSYVHVQDAYIADMGHPGDFNSIGYMIPSSRVFAYVDLADEDDNSSAGIAAVVQDNLAGCPQGAAFVATVTHTPGSSDPTWKCGIADQSGIALDPSAEKACKDLAPSFMRICE